MPTMASASWAAIGVGTGDDLRGRPGCPARRRRSPGSWPPAARLATRSVKTGRPRCRDRSRPAAGSAPAIAGARPARSRAPGPERMSVGKSKRCTVATRARSFCQEGEVRQAGAGWTDETPQMPVSVGGAIRESGRGGMHIGAELDQAALAPRRPAAHGWDAGWRRRRCRAARDSSAARAVATRSPNSAAWPARPAGRRAGRSSRTTPLCTPTSAPSRSIVSSASARHDRRGGSGRLGALGRRHQLVGPLQLGDDEQAGRVVEADRDRADRPPPGSPDPAWRRSTGAGPPARAGWARSADKASPKPVSRPPRSSTQVSSAPPWPITAVATAACNRPGPTASPR